MWTRLGLVLSAFTALIAPLAGVFDAAQQSDKLSQTMLGLCQNAAERANDAKGMARCYEFTRFDIDGWAVWWSYLQITLVGIAIAWALIFIIVATIRWILAGRK